MGQRIVHRLKHQKFPRLKLQLRTRSRYWQAVTNLDGRKWQQSLKTTDPESALLLGERWYKRLLRGATAQQKAHPIDRLSADPTMGELYASFRNTLAKPRRAYCNTKWGALAPYWAAVELPKVTPKLVREYYTYRRKHRTQYGEPPGNNTLHKDRTLLAQILRHAVEEGHLTTMPTLPHPGKIAKSPRPWFTRDEFDTLITVATKREVAAERLGARVMRKRRDLFDFIIFAVESMMRIGELRRLTVGQVKVVAATDDVSEHLLIDVVGKRGFRQTVVGGLAVDVFKDRAKGLKSSDRLWTTTLREGFTALLKAAHLERDAFGQSRNLKSLRSTGISFRVLAEMPNPDLVTIARAAGTSIAQLNDFYLKRLTAQHGARTLAKSAL